MADPADSTNTASAEPLDFLGLLDVLRFDPAEFVSIGHEAVGIPWNTAVMTAVNASGYVDQLPAEADIYFGVNPTAGPVREKAGRGTEAAITRLSCLWADLDVKPGACKDIATAHQIVGDLTAELGTRPSAIVHSGGGLHPYWPIADGWVKAGDIGPARTLIKQWQRLVVKVAGGHNAQVVDSVFDLARMLRVPGTFNNKSVSR